MNATELHRDIKRLELFVKKLMRGHITGNYLSALKGSGLLFDEVRQYQPGDDVRKIDWFITARTNEPYIKVFKEERELQIWLAVDCSASVDFGTQGQRKGQLIAYLAALFAFLAVKNNDRVGLCLFSDRIEKWLPPKKGKRHVYRVLQALLETRPIGRETRLVSVLEALQKRIKKRSVIVLISDFIDQGYERNLRLLSQKHDLIPLNVHDKREAEFSSLGVLALRDPESGQLYPVDSDAPEFQAYWQAQFTRQNNHTEQMFKKLKLDYLEFYTGQSVLKPLTTFFKRRALHRNH